MHPGQRAGGCGIDASDQRVSVRRAQHDAVQLTGHSDVIDIAPLPCQKPLVFEAAQGSPDMVPGHASAALMRIHRALRAALGAVAEI